MFCLAAFGCLEIGKGVIVGERTLSSGSFFCPHLVQITLDDSLIVSLCDASMEVTLKTCTSHVISWNVSRQRTRCILINTMTNSEENS
jgi:hypothetical protein